MYLITFYFIFIAFGFIFVRFILFLTFLGVCMLACMCIYVCLLVIFHSTEQSCTLSDSHCQIQWHFRYKGNWTCCSICVRFFGYFFFHSILSFFFFKEIWCVLFECFPFYTGGALAWFSYFSIFQCYRSSCISTGFRFFLLFFCLSPFLSLFLSLFHCSISFSIHFRRSLFLILFAFMQKILEWFFLLTPPFSC